MKKIFIKPEAKALAMQTQDMICASIVNGEGQDPNPNPTAESKRGGAFTAGSDLMLNI